MRPMCDKCEYSSLCLDIIEMARTLPKEESILGSVMCSLIKESGEYRNYWKSRFIAWKKLVEKSGEYWNKLVKKSRE